MPFRPADILSIAELAHWVVLCSMNDVVTKDGQMSLAREGILGCWSKIEERRGSLHGPNGLAVLERKDLRTHRITIRFRTDLDIRSTAWVFEQRMKSTSRWFKVIAVTDRVDRHDIDVRLIDQSDIIAAPVAQSPTIAKPMPDGVDL